MDEHKWKIILESYKSGEVGIDDVLLKMKSMPYADLGYAMIDHHRALRKGFPEVIYAQGKTKEHLLGIIRHFLSEGEENILVTRLSKEVYLNMQEDLRDVIYNELARTLVVHRKPIPKKGLVAVVTAGTSDIPVAEEAAVTLEVMGNHVLRIHDVGVAGIHRTLARVEDMNKANVIIVIAGMEGALASVIGGLVDKPVIAVPTSVGYGANFGGLSALLGMLNSCSSGVSVVNIDNGFGAAYQASLINRLVNN